MIIRLIELNKTETESREIYREQTQDFAKIQQLFGYSKAVTENKFVRVESLTFREEKIKDKRFASGSRIKYVPYWEVLK